MIGARNLLSRCLLALVLVGVWLTGSLAALGQGYHPKHPEVLQMMKRGLNSLGVYTDQRLGSKCLTALCYIKYFELLEQTDQWKNSTAVKEALQKCENSKLAYAQIDGPEGISNYSMGIAIMFLCEVDPVANRPLIEKYVAALLERQKKHGGWGYASEPTGDTSQMQYAVLGMWFAQKVAKVQIPIEVQEAATGWLMRTQGPDGGYGYQGNDPGTLTRVAQSPVSHSLTAAGCGSLYIMADLLQVTDSAATQKERPGPFKYIESTVPSDAPKKGPLTVKLDPATIREYLRTGDGWFQKNYKIESGAWQHYYMYALERYQSFRDLAHGEWNESPAWYNEGVRLLKQTQKPDGGWDGQDNAHVATCFAILFLGRSTQRAIKNVVVLGGGEQKGGYGLPPDVASIQEHDGEVVKGDITGDVNQILDLLSKGDDPKIQRMIEEAKSLKLDDDITKRQSQIEALRKTVASGDANARRYAVRSLGKVKGLDNVPRLLFALTDPDNRVVIEADLALRFVSRKPQGVGLTSDSDKVTRDEINAARAAWRAWYLSVIPDAELLD